MSDAKPDPQIGDLVTRQGHLWRITGIRWDRGGYEQSYRIERVSGTTRRIDEQWVTDLTDPA